MKEVKLTVEGLKTFYRIWGNEENKVLVFLHGWGSPKGNVFGRGTIDIMERLSKDYFCIALDLPGLIQTEPPKEAWNFDEYVEFVKQFVEIIGVRKKFILMGQSFGGGIAQAYAFRHQEDLDALILTNSILVDKPKNWYYRLMFKSMEFYSVLLDSVLIPLILKKFITSLYFGVPMETLKQRDIKKYRIMPEISYRLNLEGDYSKLTIPVLMLWGKSDTWITPIAYAKEIKKKIPNSTFYELSGGHLAVFQDRKKATDIISTFLKDCLK